MSTLSNAITELEARRSSLEMELEKIMQRLRAVKTALAASDQGASASASAGAVKVATAKKGRRGRKPGKAAKVAKTAKAATKTAAKSAGKGVTRRWFEPGEVNELMRKLITKPTRQTDVIKQLATAKGYAGKLSKKDKMRFNWAVLSALKAAVKTKRLTKQADGKVVVR